VTNGYIGLDPDALSRIVDELMPLARTSHRATTSGDASVRS
jgi:hypothetical protein